VNLNTIPDIFATGPYSFAVQVKQYPLLGTKGIGYFAGDVGDDMPPVDCLLYRDKSGKVRGILNHFPVRMGLEQAGNVAVFIDPSFRRKGIATKLLDEANRRWSINLLQQKFTPLGGAFIKSYITKRGLGIPTVTFPENQPTLNLRPH
jgi:GNAT superfamily N-acetyltransferase